MLARYLDKLNRLLDSGRDDRIRRDYARLFGEDEMERLPFVWAELPPVPDTDWPDFPYNDTFVDREKMLLSQLRPAFLHAQTDDDHPVAIRPNYGTVILPSILGGSYQLTEMSLPWAHHLLGRDAIRALVERGVPDVRAGLGAACLDTAAYYREMLAPYPNLARQTYIYHPDLQGPFDVAHLLWGPDILLALYDDPELVHALLDLVTRTYIGWLEHWKRELGEGNDVTAHWQFLMRGGAMLRDDTAVMLSGKQYREFVQPYEQRVLHTFGGCIHFCGRGDQFIGAMVQNRNLYGLNISQPELNDMRTVWALAEEHHLVLLGLPEEHIPAGTHRRVVVLRARAA